jgi:hypothetical protein
MTTAKIIHLDRHVFFPRLPACLVEINGEIYIDISSMLVKSANLSLSRMEAFEFTYQLDGLPDGIKKPCYVWENVLLISLANALVACQLSSAACGQWSQSRPYWIELAEKIVADYLEKDDVIVGVDYGLRDLVEIVCNCKNVLSNPDAEFNPVQFNQIMGAKMAEIPVMDGNKLKPSRIYRVYCFIRRVIDFFRYRGSAWA